MDQQSKNEMLCDVLEALEKVRLWAPVYKAVLQRTGDRQQALEAVRWCMRMDSDASENKKPGSKAGQC